MPAPTSIAIIPARGGSKRIPRKNIKSFNGRPIIAYSIEAALEVKLFDEVMVSTDDQEIAALARDCGAAVPFARSAENSNDFANVAEVCREVLEEYEKLGRRFDFLCCILPTAPFVTTGRLKEGYEILSSSPADSVVAVSKFTYPAQRALQIESDGKLSMIWPEYYHSRSQDLPASYHDAGQFYWIRCKSLIEQMRFFAADSRALVLPHGEVQDIDTPEDWQLAELKFKSLPARN